MDPVKITSSYGKEYSTKAAEVLCECFRKDPLITWLTCDATHEYRQAFLPHIYSTFMAANQGAGSLFYEASDWGSCAVVVPPGRKIDGVLNMLRAGILYMVWGIGLAAVKRAVIDYEGASERLKMKTLGKEQSYYVFAVGTLDSHRKKGLCAAQMRRIQTDAAKTGHPVWLEATTPASRDLYQRLGWVVIEEIKLGVGKTGADGFLKKDGEGVTIWGMCWRPNEKQEST